MPRKNHSLFFRASSLVVVFAHVLTTTSFAMEFMSGVDISALHLLQENGATYSDNGVPGDPVEIMVDHGVNWARLRLFLDADGQYLAVQDLEYTLQQALEIQASAPNMKFLLDFHYSDTWADPGKQFKPAEWAGQSGVTLQNTVRDYTRDTIIAFKDAGVMPDMVQLGNEISNGMIWPDGSTSNWNNLAALISAGINGARLGAADTSGSPAAPEPLMMIHTDKGGNQSATDGWLDQLLPRLQANGTDPDVIGLSYYPVWHYGNGSGNLAALRANLQHVADPVIEGGHNKPVVIVEAGFASRGGGNTGWSEWPTQSPEVQRQYLEDMVAAVQDVDDDMGWGVFWWYAEAVPTPGLPGEIWMNGRFGLFDEDGDLLPAIDEFPSLVEPILAGDYNDNGVVDAADYTVWRDHLGQNFQLPNEVDGVSPGIVTAADYTEWKLRFGDMLAGSGSIAQAIAVPEPAGGTLAVVTLVWLAIRTDRSRLKF
jgi:arabinogalactan endo-1,4-beta-galactosidase